QLLQKVDVALETPGALVEARSLGAVLDPGDVLGRRGNHDHEPGDQGDPKAEAHCRRDFRHVPFPLCRLSAIIKRDNRASTRQSTGQWSSSMRDLFCVLLLTAGASAALAQNAQTVPPPPPPTLLPQTATSTSCLITCDTVAATCQNGCIVVGPAATGS